MFDKTLITENRFASAKKKELTPLSLFPDEKSGRFVGSEGSIYTTTLDSCTCADFAIQGYTQPCKHMIRLAMEYGEVPGNDRVTDPGAIKARYYLGRARQYVHDSAFPDVVKFASQISAVLNGDPDIAPDAFSESMDLPDLFAAPFFSKNKNGAVKIERAYKKDWESILTTLRNRLGEEILYRLDEPDLVSVLCKGE